MGYINDRLASSNIANTLISLSNKEECKIPAIIPKFFPKTDIRSIYGGKTAFVKDDLMVIIGRKDEVYFDMKLKDKYRSWMKKRILFVEIDTECINWNYNNYKMEYYQYEEKKMKVYEIINICNATCCRLHDMVKDENITGLIFPKYSNLDIRISEQEARFAFYSEVEKMGEYKISVETPTNKKYKNFSTRPIEGDDGRSAELDMALYKADDSKTRILNIEFKAKNPKITTIEKDFLKLIKEPGDGLFFHLLQSSNSGTFLNSGNNKGIFDKYVEAIRNICNNEYMIAAQPFEGSKKIIIYVCCLRYKAKNSDNCFSIAKEIYLSENEINPIDELDIIFKDPIIEQDLECCKKTNK
jgi:hypothetical protein